MLKGLAIILFAGIVRENAVTRLRGHLAALE